MGDVYIIGAGSRGGKRSMLLKRRGSGELGNLDRLIQEKVVNMGTSTRGNRKGRAREQFVAKSAPSSGAEMPSET